MLARSFFIKSSSKLLASRTGIKSWSSSILGRIRPLILELLALEWRKFHTSDLEYLWSQLINLDQILCVAALGWGKGCIRFWGRLDHSGERSLPFGLLGSSPDRMGLEPASVRQHFQTWISPRPAGQLQSNFIWSIIGMGERLHVVLVQIKSELWFPWQRIASIGL